MPRTANPNGRGGARQGTVGTQYANRTDLQGAVPVATAPGQPYGARAAQAAAQNAVPVAAPPAPGSQAPSASPSGGPGAPPAAPLGIPGAQATPGPRPLPGQLPFTGPTARPTEPITTGLARGAGPGPEALTGIGAIARDTAPSDSTVALLASLADSPTAGSDLRDIAGLAMATRR